MAIYYEHYCPDSQGFLLRQFASVYDEFKDMLDVMLVPFGKAEVKFLISTMSDNENNIFPSKIK